MTVLISLVYSLNICLSWNYLLQSPGVSLDYRVLIVRSIVSLTGLDFTPTI